MVAGFYMGEDDPKNINYILHLTDEKLHQSPKMKIIGLPLGSTSSPDYVLRDLLDTGSGFVAPKINAYQQSYSEGGFMRYYRFSTQNLMHATGRIFRILYGMPWLERYQVAIMTVQQAGLFGTRQGSPFLPAALVQAFPSCLLNLNVSFFTAEQAKLMLLIFDPNENPNSPYDEVDRALVLEHFATCFIFWLIGCSLALLTAIFEYCLNPAGNKWEEKSQRKIFTIARKSNAWK